MKQCTKCQKTLPLEFFYTNKYHKDGRGSRCKECVKFSSRHQKQNKETRKAWVSRNKEKLYAYQVKYREKHIEKAREYAKLYKRTKQQQHRLTKYGISQETYDFLKQRQNNSCGICGRVFENKISPQVDHNHKTGKVRGLLCWNCNIRLGYLESEIFCSQAKKYLQCEYIEIKNKES